MVEHLKVAFSLRGLGGKREQETVLKVSVDKFLAINILINIFHCVIFHYVIYWGKSRCFIG